jgi:hypothetical protein
MEALAGIAARFESGVKQRERPRIVTQLGWLKTVRFWPGPEFRYGQHAADGRVAFKVPLHRFPAGVAQVREFHGGARPGRKRLLGAYRPVWPEGRSLYCERNG